MKFHSSNQQVKREKSMRFPFFTMTPLLIAFIFLASEINRLLLIARLALQSGVRCGEKQ